jgi:excisionase family DNA binding protein
MGTDVIIQKLQKLEADLSELKLLKKDVLSFNEACIYLDISASCLYKLTSKVQIPHYCPNGKKLYFKRAELDGWLLQNHKTESDKEEIDKFVANYLIKNAKRKQ